MERCATDASASASASARMVAASPPVKNEKMSSAALPSAIACADEIDRRMRTLPEIARQSLREQEACIRGRRQGNGKRDRRQPRKDGRLAAELQEDPRAGYGAMRHQQERAARQPRCPVRPREDQQEALRSLEVDDEHDGGEERKERGDDRPAERDEHRPVAQHPEERGKHERARRDALGQEIDDEIEPPGFPVRDVVIDARIARAHRVGCGGTERPQQHLALTKHERLRCDLRPDRGLVGAEIKDFWSRALFRLAHHERIALHDLRHPALRVVEIAEDAALGRDRRSRTPAAARSRCGSRRNCTSPRSGCSGR